MGIVASDLSQDPDTEALLKRADSLMYEEKRKVRSAQRPKRRAKAAGVLRRMK
jgi:hypothetical protein